MKGTDGSSSAVDKAAGGSQYWSRLATSPSNSEMPTAIGKLRSRAATTAAKDDVINAVMLAIESPPRGATSTPHRPANDIVTAHTPHEMRAVVVPDKDVRASESTMARTRSPTEVRFRISTPELTTRGTAIYTIIWPREMTVPRTPYYCTTTP